MEWTYSRQIHRQESIESVARYVLEALQQLIAHCQSPDAGGYTPSDFPDVDMNQEELDRLLAGI
jgi:non-ribosomal peptide synthase protein (TIGR01720 family)